MARPPEPGGLLRRYGDALGRCDNFLGTWGTLTKVPPNHMATRARRHSVVTSPTLGSKPTSASDPDCAPLRTRRLTIRFLRRERKRPRPPGRAYEHRARRSGKSWPLRALVDTEVGWVASFLDDSETQRLSVEATGRRVVWPCPDTVDTRLVRRRSDQRGASAPSTIPRGRVARIAMRASATVKMVARRVRAGRPSKVPNRGESWE